MRERIEQIVRADRDAKLAKARAEYEHVKRTQPTNWVASRPFDEHSHKASYGDCAEVVMSLVAVCDAVRECRVSRSEMKGFPYRSGGQSGAKRDPKEPCCDSVERHGFYTDLGLSLMTPRFGKGYIRLSGDPEDVHEVPNAMNPAVKTVPAFVKAIAPYADAGLWAEVRKLVEPELAALEAQYDELVARIAPEADRFAERYARKLQKSRERAKRPDQVAKREAEARARARESLSGLMGGPSFKSVLDKWSAADLLGYLRLCQTDAAVLRELMSWSTKLPLGSKSLELSDVEAALELARIRDVMES